MSKVYYKKIENSNDTKTTNKIVYKMLETIVKENNIEMERTIPLKVHF